MIITIKKRIKKVGGPEKNGRITTREVKDKTMVDLTKKMNVKL